MKKIITITLTVVLLLSAFCLPVSAYGGYAHWQIATQTVSAKKIPTTNNYAQAYKTGVLLADIGQANWDDKYANNNKKLKSDGEDFTNKMLEIAPFNEQAKYFAKGWQSHYLQDVDTNDGGLKYIIGSEDSDPYYVNYGQIDEYLRDKRKISCPINGTANMYVSYPAIRNTYKALFNFSPTDGQIDSEIKGLFLRYHGLITLNTSGMDSGQISRMDTRFANLASSSYKKSAINSISTANTKTSNIDTLDILVEMRDSSSALPLLMSLESQARSLSHIETISGDKATGAEVRFVIDDPEAYNNIVNQYVTLLEKTSVK